MNRLILLGNGFDLAHGMKTSYVDFLLWYIAQRVKKTVEVGETTTDPLLTVSLSMDYRAIRTTDDNEIASYVRQCYEDGFNLNKFGKPALFWDNRTYRYPYTFSIKSSILRAMITQCSIKRWVDVEAVFYESLLEVLNTKVSSDIKEEQLQVINESMREIIRLLQMYLSGLPKQSINTKYTSIIHDFITRDDLESSQGKAEVLLLTDDEGKAVFHKRPDKIHVLNFNYTDTIELYVDATGYNDPDIQINYIHGKLNSTANPIIFGFGDEIDKRYSEIENEAAQGYFEHIKSFGYLRTSNYKDLVRFVDGGPFQTVILGHSCGLSDRTMLHMILEHDNCKSIKLYYHNTTTGNNYTQTTYEIARHFHDKAVMRKRIISLDGSTEMPQS